MEFVLLEWSSAEKWNDNLICESMPQTPLSLSLSLSHTHSHTHSYLSKSFSAFAALLKMALVCWWNSTNVNSLVEMIY